MNTASPWDGLGARGRRFQERQQALFERAQLLREAARRGGRLERELAREVGRALRLIAFGEHPAKTLKVDVRAIGRKPGATRSTAFARKLRQGQVPGWNAEPPSMARDRQRQLLERLRRLHAFAEEFSRAADGQECRIRPELLEFVAWAYASIAAGGDPHAALGIRAKRGEHHSALKAEAITRMVHGWIAAATDRSSPHRLSVKEAIAQAADLFDLDRSYVGRTWRSSSAHRGAVFSLTGKRARP